MSSCAVFTQSFLFCSRPLPSLLLSLVRQVSCLNAMQTFCFLGTYRVSSTGFYLIQSSEQHSEVDVIIPFYRGGTEAPEKEGFSDAAQPGSKAKSGLGHPCRSLSVALGLPRPPAPEPFEESDGGLFISVPAAQASRSHSHCLGLFDLHVLPGYLWLLNGFS